MLRFVGLWSMALACLTLLPTTGAAGDLTLPVERKPLDQEIHKLLRDVINRGADLYNRGDSNGCYRLYEGALMTVRALSDNRPEWQKTITEAVKQAEETPQLFQRAFVLRKVIDKIRDECAAAAKVDGAPGPSLYERVGAERGLVGIVDEWVGVVVADPRVNITRSGKIQLDEEKVRSLKLHMIDYVGQEIGGPQKYIGKSMKEAHKGMAITEAQFNAFSQDLKIVLERRGIRSEDAAVILKSIRELKQDIVEAK